MIDPRQLQAYQYAKAEIGTAEIPGPKHNPAVVNWFADVGHSWVSDDETAWCAAFIGAMLERAGLTSTRKLNARSYLDWGDTEITLAAAQEGDIVVFYRGDPNGWQGHVGFFSALRGDKIMVLGGNQGNEVSIAPYSKTRLLGIRRISAKPMKASKAQKVFPPLLTPEQAREAEIAAQRGRTTPNSLTALLRALWAAVTALIGRIRK